VVSFTDIKQIEKKMTALVIPNAISVSTADTKVSHPMFGCENARFRLASSVMPVTHIDCQV